MKKGYFLSFGIALMLLFSLNVSAQDGSFKSTATKWLTANAREYNFSSSDVKDLRVTNEYFSDGMNVTLLYLNQAYKGIKIHNAISTVAIRDGKVFNFANAFLSDIESKVNTVTPSLTPKQAIDKVAAKYNLGAVTGVDLIESSQNKYTFSKGSISATKIEVELQYASLNDGEKLKLAYDLHVQELGGKNWYSVRVDALTGNIIEMNNWVISCSFGDHTNHASHNMTKPVVEKGAEFNLFKAENSSVALGAKYRVLKLPIESPLFGEPTIVTDPEYLIASPFGWHDTNGVAGAEYTITRGNNVWALDDRNGDNVQNGHSADGGATLDFTTFSTDIKTQPQIYQDYSITNLFYVNNMMHDILYKYGFNEVAGNYQANNYGKGGTQGDFVVADAQDGSGLSNANFSASPDGFNGRMQMYLWKKQVINFAKKPLKINTGTYAGESWFAEPGAFGGSLTIPGMTRELVLVDDGDATKAVPDVHDACEGVGSSPLFDKIAVITRNNCEFGVKVSNAEFAGAVAVIVTNNDMAKPDQVVSMQGGASGDFVNIPSVNISYNDGVKLIAALKAGETISATLFDDGPFHPDGDLDSGIIAHEYTHGLSIRLTGGPSTAGCLNRTSHPNQMGEGWSDWAFYMVTMLDTDKADKARGLANFPVFGSKTSRGIRNRPYTTNFAENEYTYASTNDTALSVPHGVGTVWGTILWDLSWGYIKKYGFDPDIINGTGGNNKAMQLVVDGMKLQPCNPSYPEARDALLAAEQATTAGVDACLIWSVFAKRGVGVGASAGAKSSRTDQIESFVKPDFTQPAYASCVLLSVEDFKFKDAFKVYPNPTNGVLNISSIKPFGKVQISISDINGRQIVTKTDTIISKSSISLDGLQAGMYILTIKGDDFSVNEKIIKQ